MGNRSDDFNRANGSLNSATPSDAGSAWNAATGWDVSSNQAKPNAANFTRETAYLEASSSVGSSQLTVATTGNSGGPLMRASDANHFIVCYVAGNTLANYKKTAANTYTQIGSTYTGTINAGDVIKLDIDSSNAIRAYQNGTLRVGPNTDSTYSTNTGAGFECYSNVTTVRFDDWSYTDAAGGGGVSVTPDASALTLASFAPTVARTANVAVAPGLAALTLATFAPTLARTANVSIVPGVAALTLNSFAPTVAQTTNASLTPGVAAMTLATFAPTVAQGSASTLIPGAAALSLAAFAPTLARTTNASLAPGVASIAVATFAPTVQRTTGLTLTPAPAALVVQAFAPTLAQSGSVNLSPAAAALVLQIHAPNLQQSGSIVRGALMQARKDRSLPPSGRTAQLATSRRPAQ